MTREITIGDSIVIDVGNNKLTNVADGVAADDAATVGQLGGASPPSGSAGGVLDGTYPNPGLAAGVAGAGLAETTNVLSVNVDGSTLEISSDALRVKADGITANEIAAGAVGASELASTAVTAATYGDATHVGQFTVDADGRLTAAAAVAITAAGGLTPEVPTGTINGSNVTFTLSATPSPSASLLLWKNGLYQLQGTDYTLSGATITMTVAPATGSSLVAAVPAIGGTSAAIGSSSLVYRYTVTGSDKASIDTGVDTADAGSNDWTNGDFLEVYIYARIDEAVALGLIDLTFNNDTSAIYERVYNTMTNNSVAGANEKTNNAMRLNVAGASCAASVFSSNCLRIPNYAGTVGFKVFQYDEGVPDTTAGNTRHLTVTGGYRSTSAITRIKITPETALKKLVVGTQLLIYKRLAS